MKSHRAALLAGLALAAAVPLAYAAEPLVDPPGPANPSPFAVRQWALSAGLKPESYNLVGILADGVFYAEKNTRVTSRPGRPQEVVLGLRFERFAPAKGETDKPIRSEQADLWIRCGSPVMTRLNTRSRAFAEHDMRGGYVGPGDEAVWAQMAPGGKTEAAIAAGSLAARFVGGPCRSRPLAPMRPSPQRGRAG